MSSRDSYCEMWLEANRQRLANVVDERGEDVAIVDNPSAEPLLYKVVVKMHNVPPNTGYDCLYVKLTIDGQEAAHGKVSESRCFISRISTHNESKLAFAPLLASSSLSNVPTQVNDIGEIKAIVKLARRKGSIKRRRYRAHSSNTNTLQRLTVPECKNMFSVQTVSVGHKVKGTSVSASYSSRIYSSLSLKYQSKFALQLRKLIPEDVVPPADEHRAQGRDGNDEMIDLSRQGDSDGDGDGDVKPQIRKREIIPKEAVNSVIDLTGSDDDNKF